MVCVSQAHEGRQRGHRVPIGDDCGIPYCLGVGKMMYLYRSMLSLNDMRHFGVNLIVKPFGLRLKADSIIPLGTGLLARTLGPNR